MYVTVQYTQCKRRGCAFWNPCLTALCYVVVSAACSHIHTKQLVIFLEQDLTLTLRRQVQREIKTNTRETKEVIRPLWRQNHTLGIM